MKIYWITGQPGCGKTELGKCIKKHFIHSLIIDGDDIREISNNKDYSEEGRRKNIETAQILSKYVCKIGYRPIVTMVSPYRDQREEFKKNNDVVEIYLHTTDIRGREDFFVSNYEPPLENFIDLDSTGLTVDDLFNNLMVKLGGNIY